MTAKEYPEKVAGQASVYRLDSFELTVEFSYSREFKSEYLKYLEIGQGVRVPLYTTPPSVDALIAEIDAVERFEVVPCDSFNFGMNPSEIGDWFDVDDIQAILDKYRSAK